MNTKQSTPQAVTNCTAPPPPKGLVPIGCAASDIGLSRAGLRILLIRTQKGIRHDGKLYVAPEEIAAIKAAYATLGIRPHA
jgi:hypothetical protein